MADSEYVLVRRSDLMDLDDAADRLSPSILLSESVLRLRAALAADQTEDVARTIHAWAPWDSLSMDRERTLARAVLGASGD